LSLKNFQYELCKLLFPDFGIVEFIILIGRASGSIEMKYIKVWKFSSAPGWFSGSA
jgi:hypothetical protein